LLISKRNINHLLQRPGWNGYDVFLLMCILSFILQENLPHNTRQLQQVRSMHCNGSHW
jgi:hypothetical protein